MPFVIGLLLFMFPYDVIVKLVLVLLKRLSQSTRNTVDDELVKVLEDKFNKPEV